MEKLFGQARQRCGGNFYIDIVDVLAVMRMQILHQLLKRDLLPDPCSTVKCPSCTLEPTSDDIDVLQSLNFSATQELLASEDTMKHKVIYIASYIAKNHPQVDNDEESISSTFLDELIRGGLTVPTLSTVFFMHCRIQAQSPITLTNM